MPAQSPQRQRLRTFMEARREELRLPWTAIASAGGTSVKTISNVRIGEQGILPETRHMIETGLRWAPGSIEAILTGGDPVPLAEPPRPAPQPLPAAIAPPPGYLDAAGTSRVQPYFDAIWLRIRDLALRGIADPAGSDVFDNSDDAADWDSYCRRGLPVERRVWLLAGLQAYDPAAGERERGTGLSPDPGRTSPGGHDVPADRSAGRLAIAWPQAVT